MRQHPGLEGRHHHNQCKGAGNHQEKPERGNAYRVDAGQIQRRAGHNHHQANHQAVVPLADPRNQPFQIGDK